MGIQNFSLNVVQHEKRNFVSQSSPVMFCLLYEHINGISNYFTLILFFVQFLDYSDKGAIYYVTRAIAIFSHVKITCYFHA